MENGDEVGRNEVSAFVCNESRWGDMGRNHVSPLEMGSKGGAGYPKIPRLKKSDEGRSENAEKKQDRNTAESGCARRVWFA
jgi:hypothetical protein